MNVGNPTTGVPYSKTFSPYCVGRNPSRTTFLDVVDVDISSQGRISNLRIIDLIGYPWWEKDSGMVLLIQHKEMLRR
jgi:hypothetical protein